MTVDRPGWMLALVEPTEEMLANTVDDRGRPRILDFTTPEERGEAFIMPRYIYRAMIAASPHRGRMRSGGSPMSFSTTLPPVRFERRPPHDEIDPADATHYSEITPPQGD